MSVYGHERKAKTKEQDYCGCLGADARESEQILLSLRLIPAGQKLQVDRACVALDPKQSLFYPLRLHLCQTPHFDMLCNLPFRSLEQLLISRIGDLQIAESPVRVGIRGILRQHRLDQEIYGIYIFCLRDAVKILQDLYTALCFGLHPYKVSQSSLKRIGKERIGRGLARKDITSQVAELAMNFADIYPFLTAILIGALIGTERQRRLAEDKVRGVAGLRTFTLIALLGALSATLANYYGPTFALAAFASFTILVGIGYASSVSTLGRIDFTAAVAAVVTFTLGMLTRFEESMLLAVALAILTTWILATRRISHHYVEALSETDILDTLKMGIIALVIYPLLPDTTLDPWGVLNPREIWLMVVLVSLIGYIGYVLIRILGAERGLTLTGILGGLVSSTAVTTAMASEVKINREIISSAVFATVIASCTMFPRVLFVVLVVNRDLFIPLLPKLLSMTIVGVALAYLLMRKSAPLGKEVAVKDPFRIVPALKFGAFFAFVLLTSKLASTYFGDAGAYAAAVIGGLADVDAITLSMATLAKSTLNPEIAATAITLAAITNTLVKLSISYILGNREFGNRIATIFVPMILIGLLVAVLI